jgi:hypothetical protein
MNLIRQYYITHRLLFWICGIGLLIRIITGILIPPGFDEAYYAQYAGNLAWGYYDHPPAVALTAGIGYWLTGIWTPLTLRLGAILLFLGSCYLLYEICRRLFNQKAAIFSLLLFHTTPYFFFGMGLFVFPDNALGFFWLLALYSLVRLHQSDNPHWFLLWGASLGLAMMAKYHAVLLAGATGFILLLYREWRHYLRTPQLYLSFIVAMLLFLPNLLWNMHHDWITLATQFGKGTSGGFNLSFTLFLQGVLIQAGYLLPWVMFLLLWATGHYLRKNTPEYRWLIPFILIPVLMFTLIGATRIILPHWPMPGYLGGIILTGCWLSRFQKNFGRNMITISGIVTGLIAILFIVQTYTGIFPLPIKGDPTLDGYGWKQVITTLEEKKVLTGSNQFLLAHKWFTGGQLAFAANSKYPVAVFSEKALHGFAFWTDFSKLAAKDGLFITTERFSDNPQTMYADYFTSITFLDSLQVKRSGRNAEAFLIWQCRGYKNNYQPPYGQRMR